MGRRRSRCECMLGEEGWLGRGPSLRFGGANLEEGELDANAFFYGRFYGLLLWMHSCLARALLFQTSPTREPIRALIAQCWRNQTSSSE